MNGAPLRARPALREMLDELGTTFVKFGQLLSTRPDIVPPDIIAELRGLQDDVRPFPFAEVERVVQEELGQPIERLFLEFDEEPLAAASIGQVHRAVLPNGRRVVVKVQRPRAAAGRGRHGAAPPGGPAGAGACPRARLPRRRGAVDEFARSIRQELDYRLEGRNAEVFHRNFAGHPHVRCRGLLELHAGAGAHAGAARRRQLPISTSTPGRSRSAAGSPTGSPRAG